MVIVSDKYLEVSNQAQEPIGLLRVVLYLEDLGLASAQESKANAAQISSAPVMPGAGGVEEQTVWQLEMWKRAEMAKFLAHLKQKEMEKIDEVTKIWKQREAEREKTFTESLQKVQKLEGKVRSKATDLQRREERII